MVRRTKEEAEQTRERLLDTAEQVFLQDGVARTSLQRIADAAGLTRGAIYWHFKDKAELFNAMMERVRLPCEAAHDAQARGMTPDTDPIETLRDFAWVPIARMLDDERTRRVFTIAIHRTEYSDEMRPALERHTAAIEDFRARAERLIAAGQARGLLDTAVQARAASIGFIALIHLLIKHEQAKFLLWMENNLKGKHVSYEIRAIVRDELKAMKRDPHRLSDSAQEKVLKLL